MITVGGIRAWSEVVQPSLHKGGKGLVPVLGQLTLLLKVSKCCRTRGAPIHAADT